MPFRKRARITIENIADEPMTLYYQVNYTLTEVPDDAAYFHAHFRRTNPIPYKSDYTVIDGVAGQGQFVGMYLAWGQNNNGWWGEGEVKFFLDGDGEFPTIATTGLEDYFCGSYNFDPSPKHDQGLVTYTTPYAGFHQVIRPSSDYRTQFRMGMYRFHVMDPIRFERDLKVTVQALGWGYNGRYLPMQDDVASVAYWYQTLPAPKLQPLPAREFLLARLGIALVLAGAVDRREPGLAADDPALLRRPEVARRIVEGAEHDLDLGRRQVEEAGAAGGAEAPPDEGARLAGRREGRRRPVGIGHRHAAGRLAAVEAVADADDRRLAPHFEPHRAADASAVAYARAVGVARRTWLEDRIFGHRTSGDAQTAADATRPARSPLAPVAAGSGHCFRTIRAPPASAR